MRSTNICRVLTLGIHNTFTEALYLDPHLCACMHIHFPIPAHVEVTVHIRAYAHVHLSTQRPHIYIWNMQDTHFPDLGVSVSATVWKT